MKTPAFIRDHSWAIGFLVGFLVGSLVLSRLPIFNSHQTWAVIGILTFWLLCGNVAFRITLRGRKPIEWLEGSVNRKDRAEYAFICHNQRVLLLQGPFGLIATICRILVRRWRERRANRSDTNLFVLLLLSASLLTGGCAAATQRIGSRISVSSTIPILSMDRRIVRVVNNTGDTLVVRGDQMSEVAISDHQEIEFPLYGGESREISFVATGESGVTSRTFSVYGSRSWGGSQQSDVWIVNRSDLSRD